MSALALRAAKPAPCRDKDKCPPPNEGEALEAELRPTGRGNRWGVQAKKASLEPYLPSHVRACANNEVADPPWFLNVWELAKPLVQTRMVYTCGSYRCPSAQCQKKAAHTDFARISKALHTSGLEAQGWVFFVLTIDQRDFYKTGKKPYKDEQEAFKRLSNNTRFFLRRLRRRQTTRGERPLGNEWVGTVEIQRNGWPHVNLLVYAPELAAELRAAQAIGPHDQRARRHRAQIVEPWLLDAVTGTGWGTISTAEGVRDAEAMAGYIVKLGGEFGRTSGEIAKITQAPVNARMKLRRIRAGKGFLPPQGAQQRSGEWTGVMMRRRLIQGRLTVGPMIEPDQVKPKGDTLDEQLENSARYARGVQEAIKREQAALDDDLRIAALITTGGEARVRGWIEKRQRGRVLRLVREPETGVDTLRGLVNPPRKKTVDTPNLPKESRLKSAIVAGS